MEIAGCRALVVGATGVIGGAFARALAGRGAVVAVAGRDRGCRRLLRRVGAAGRGRGIPDDRERACPDGPAARGPAPPCPDGTVAAITGVVAEHPQPFMADYSASKAALAAWLRAVRREQRARHVRVLEVSLPHQDTGFAGRAARGTPPALPPGADLDAAITHLVAAVANGVEAVRPGADGALVDELRAR